MLEAICFEDVLNDIRKKRDTKTQIIGILIANPGTEFVRENILNRISQFHHRSGESMNFYFPGYGAYWHDSIPDSENVCKIDSIQWSFSNKLYSDFIFHLEEVSKYSYSGETELLLLEISGNELRFDNVLVFWLDRMVADGVIYSVSNFFEEIFKITKSGSSIFSLSDTLALRGIGGSMLDLVEMKLPIRKLMKGKHFLIADFTK
ncbi:hypothetical protein IR194_04470 [Exiguobacterium sp. PBE]|nr:hypothetical protein IR194_04470 [Exiguobacterium sp. PBE]